VVSVFGPPCILIDLRKDGSRQSAADGLRRQIPRRQVQLHVDDRRRRTSPAEHHVVSLRPTNQQRLSAPRDPDDDVTGRPWLPATLQCTRIRQRSIPMYSI